jgi:23S rRNA (guanosine2251-2'-O)-methyltransferase
VVILDGITDPHNLGAVLRSADQFGVDLVVLPERRSAHLGDTVSRTSAGADRWVRTAAATNVSRAIAALQERGFWVYGADVEGAPAHTIDLTGNVALVFGREGEGLHRLVRESCDQLLCIPTTGKIDSLNVSVSAGILLYEVRRQAGFPRRNAED